MAIYRPTYRDKKTGELRRSRGWWLKIRDPEGVRRLINLKVRDKKAAEFKAAQIRRRLELRWAGVDTLDEDAGTRRPIDLAEEYARELERQKRAPSHVSQIRLRLGRVLAGAERLSEVTTKFLREALGRLAAEHGLGGKSQNYHRLAVLGFFNWLVRETRWTTNPARNVARAREEEPEVPWRPLSPEELDRLLAVTPEPRATIYRVAATTGLRRREIRALAWRHLDLERGLLALPSRLAKSRKPVLLPLTATAVEALRAIRGTAGVDDPVFCRPLRRGGTRSAVPLMKTVYADLERAGIPALTPEGKIVFHSLRVSLGTNLARAGVPLTVAQKLLRHSTPTLTANIYTKHGLGEAAAALAKIDPAPSARPAPRLVLGPNAGTGLTEVTRGPANPAASAPSTPPETEAANPQGVGRMDGPGIEPGTPGFSARPNDARSVGGVAP